MADQWRLGTLIDRLHEARLVAPLADVTFEDGTYVQGMYPRRVADGGGWELALGYGPSTRRPGATDRARFVTQLSAAACGHGLAASDPRDGRYVVTRRIRIAKANPMVDQVSAPIVGLRVEDSGLITILCEEPRVSMHDERVKVTRRHEYVLPNPVPMGDLGKAHACARQAWGAAHTGQHEYDDSLMVTHADDEIIIYWEETVDG